MKQKKKSGLSTSLEESAASGSDSKGRIIKIGERYKGKQAGVIVSKKGISPTVHYGKRGPFPITIINCNPRSPTRPTANQGGSGILTSKEKVFALQTTPHLVSDVSATTTTTSTQFRPTTQDSTKKTSRQTSLSLNPKTFQTTTFSVRDSLARVFQSLERGVGSRTPEGLFSLKSPEFSEIKNLKWFYWKTSRDSFLTTLTRHSESSSTPFGNWGMWDITKCLTARISESRRTGSVSLSSVLEENVPQKYFLSDKSVKRLLSYKDSSLVQSQQEGQSQKQTETTSLKVTGRHYE